MIERLLPALLWCLTASAMAQEPGPWTSLWNGTSLEGWRETPFTDAGKVRLEDNAIVLGAGKLTGITRTTPLPKSNYELRLEARRIDGQDFFAGITFPVHDAHCTWIVGGWGGRVVGLSSLDGYDASENETSTARDFENGRWYSLSLRVTDGWIQAWIDGEKVVEISIASRKVGLRPGEIELSAPFGIASYATAAALRKLEYRVIPPPAP